MQGVWKIVNSLLSNENTNCLLKNWKTKKEDKVCNTEQAYSVMQ